MKSSFLNQFHYCFECKKIVEDDSELFYVEDNPSKTFCSEECAEDFFSPLRSFFEKKEKELRAELSLQNEDCQHYSEDVHLLEKAMKAPHEVWCQDRGVFGEVFTFISVQETFYHIFLCHLVDNFPSYIFRVITTKSTKLVNKFRNGISMQDLTRFGVPMTDALEINSEGMMMLEAKKSLYLADLMSSWDEDDISLDDFHHYATYMPETFQDPEQIYMSVDEDGDEIFTHIKAYANAKESFFYYVLVLLVKAQDGSEKKVPILSFPSYRRDIYKEKSSGLLVEARMKN